MCSLHLTHSSTYTWSSGHTHTPGAVDTHTHTWSSGHTHTHTHLEQWTHTHTWSSGHTHTHTPGAVDTHTHTPGAVDTHTHTHTFTFTLFSRRFYPKRLTLHSSYSFYI